MPDSIQIAGGEAIGKTRLNIIYKYASDINDFLPIIRGAIFSTSAHPTRESLFLSILLRKPSSERSRRSKPSTIGRYKPSKTVKRGPSLSYNWRR